MLEINNIKVEKDFRDSRVGKLICILPIKRNNQIYWICECDCGKLTKVRTPHLSAERIKSCGCLHKEANKKARQTHATFTKEFSTSYRRRLYSRWTNMKQRCYNKNNTAYRNYGAKGIKMDDKWRLDFMEFFRYIESNFPDYREKLDLGYHFDRYPDRWGDYAPGNLRLVSPAENNLNKDRPTPRGKENLVGNKYNRLTVIKLGETSDRKRRYWICTCDCGNQVEVSTSSLKNGSTKSCGCLKLEKTSKRFKKRGLSNHPLRAVLVGLIQRCYNPNNAKYHLLGGKGIKVCDEWRDKENGLGNFYDWAVGSGGWHKGLCIDRVDANKDFSPGNCQFISRSEKARKQDTSRFDKSPTK